MTSPAATVAGFEIVIDPPPAPLSPVEVSPVEIESVEYGPTNGPPPGAPTGCTESAEVSTIARPRSTRPLPVWSTLPAGEAVFASRETMTPFEAPNDEARSSAAEPATIAAEADVPLTAP